MPLAFKSIVRFLKDGLHGLVIKMDQNVAGLWSDFFVWFFFILYRLFKYCFITCFPVVCLWWTKFLILVSFHFLTMMFNNPRSLPAHKKIFTRMQVINLEGVLRNRVQMFTWSGIYNRDILHPRAYTTPGPPNRANRRSPAPDPVGLPSPTKIDSRDIQDVFQQLSLEIQSHRTQVPRLRDWPCLGVV